MEILIQIGRRCFSITIGHDTRWFSQMPLVMLVELIYNDHRQVDYAKTIWQSPRFLDAKLPLTVEEAMIEAKKEIKKLLEYQPWPEDDWIQISKDWDLNVCLDWTGKPSADLYPVVNGITNTSTWHNVL